MTDKQITDLTVGSAPDGTEIYAGTQGGNSRKFTGTEIAHSGFCGCLVKKASDLTGQNITTATAITWDTETYDYGGWHDTGSNTSRMTVPTGVTRVRLLGQIRLENVNANNWAAAFVKKNGSAAFDGPPEQLIGNASSSVFVQIVSPVLEVTAGDYFELFGQVQSDTSVDIKAQTSWFAIEEVTGTI